MYEDADDGDSGVHGGSAVSAGGGCRTRPGQLCPPRPLPALRSALMHRSGAGATARHSHTNAVEHSTLAAAGCASAYLPVINHRTKFHFNV